MASQSIGGEIVHADAEAMVPEAASSVPRSRTPGFAANSALSSRCPGDLVRVLETGTRSSLCAPDIASDDRTERAHRQTTNWQVITTVRYYLLQVSDDQKR
jgi:hypothetical protein